MDKPEYQWELFPSVGSLTEPPFPRAAKKKQGCPAQDIVVRMKESNANSDCLGQYYKHLYSEAINKPPTPFFEKLFFNYGKIQIYPLSHF